MRLDPYHLGRNIFFCSRRLILNFSLLPRIYGCGTSQKKSAGRSKMVRISTPSPVLPESASHLQQSNKDLLQPCPQGVNWRLWGTQLTVSRRLVLRSPGVSAGGAKDRLEEAKRPSAVIGAPILTPRGHTIAGEKIGEGGRGTLQLFLLSLPFRTVFASSRPPWGIPLPYPHSN